MSGAGGGRGPVPGAAGGGPIRRIRAVRRKGWGAPSEVSFAALNTQ